MGLDMYLDRTKKIEGMTTKQIWATYDNITARKNGYTYEEWCGGIRMTFAKIGKLKCWQM